MRLRKIRLVLLAFAIILAIIIYRNSVDTNKQKKIIIPTYQILNSKNAQDFSQLTVIILEFESFDNDVFEVCQSILAACLHKCKVLVISEDYIYPPLKLPSHVLHIVLKLDLLKPPLNVVNLLSTSTYVMLLPDGARLSSHSQLKDHIHLLEAGDTQVVALAVGGNPLICHHYTFDIKLWTLVVTPAPHSEACDGISGKAAFLLRTSYFVKLTYPLARPVTLSIGVQGTANGWKIHVGRGAILGEGRHLYTTDQLRWRYQALEEERIKLLYKNLGVKKVVEANQNVQWYGCTRNSPRCFPTVANDTPSYLYEGRWTPPCCLEGLRVVARHVFQVLRTCRAGWWLEGGSLLGAVRSGDLIPWDYDVDIGIYSNDVDRCPQLKASRWQTLEDNDGFVWQKATEGSFYRVHYSTSNNLHVDVFPFYPKDGEMIRAYTWNSRHRQDTDFPEHFLRPLSTIKFAGVTASTPNNVRDFLEFKFGMGVIEDPQYPNLEMIKFYNISLPSRSLN